MYYSYNWCYLYDILSFIAYIAFNDPSPMKASELLNQDDAVERLARLAGSH